MITTINEFKKINENNVYKFHEDDISNKDDISNFFKYLYTEYNLNLHPDDDFSDYIDKDGNDTFTKDEAEYLNKIMNKCFFICQAEHLDIYQIGIDIKKELNM